MGAAIIAAGVYLAIQTKASGEALQYFGTAGVAAGGAIWAAGKDMDRTLTREIKAHDRQNQEDLRIYRMVRFMPTWIAIDLKPSAGVENSVSLNFGRGVELVNHF